MHLTALARDRTGKAASVPLTLIYSRPDGVEHSRVALADQAQGGRNTTFNIAGSAMTGTWRVRVTHRSEIAGPSRRRPFSSRTSYPNVSS